MTMPWSARWRRAAAPYCARRRCCCRHAAADGRPDGPGPRALAYGSDLRNTAQVTADNIDPASENDESTAAVPGGHVTDPSADLALTKDRHLRSAAPPGAGRLDHLGDQGEAGSGVHGQRL
ncbi:hypothetical protein SLAV_10640 [Streptomyces lavendulae subsp. lavendulae]|uniref:Uncharacterized protein n=1 Tax=Streptomyces lavendulae subsp. lavendulae TaxID=58340 RepID=A0A2K8PB86_STRLA|nr:hypothetical protein SLAV_10640 [Streptomyces lavendulae subsp. lavendulae]QUQ53827.1 hypothetical protein SLLC_08670 [Streptomyces lavendulae subsp. lavendulae]